MSEGMRIQSQLAADLEVYRAKGELIALRDENARLREALVAIQKSCKAQDEYSSWLLGITEAALQPERGSL